MILMQLIVESKVFCRSWTVFKMNIFDVIFCYDLRLSLLFCRADRCPVEVDTSDRWIQCASMSCRRWPAASTIRSPAASTVRRLPLYPPLGSVAPLRTAVGPVASYMESYIAGFHASYLHGKQHPRQANWWTSSNDEYVFVIAAVWPDLLGELFWDSMEDETWSLLGRAVPCCPDSRVSDSKLLAILQQLIILFRYILYTYVLYSIDRGLKNVTVSRI